MTLYSAYDILWWRQKVRLPKPAACLGSKQRRKQQLLVVSKTWEGKFYGIFANVKPTTVRSKIDPRFKVTIDEFKHHKLNIINILNHFNHWNLHQFGPCHFSLWLPTKYKACTSLHSEGWWLIGWNAWNHHGTQVSNLKNHPFQIGNKYGNTNLQMLYSNNLYCWTKSRTA